MNNENLKDVFKQAAEISSVVPKEMQEIAFNRALDELLSSKKTVKRTPTKTTRKRTDIVNEKRGDDVTLTLLSDLDRTSCPEIGQASRVLERSLFLLRQVRDKHNIDGLSGTQIATILTDKFRLRTSRQSVTQALDVAGNKVNRKKIDGKVTYHLMQSGDDYLNTEDFSKNQVIAKKKEKKVIKNDEKSPATVEIVKNSRNSGRPGPGAMLKILIESSFFNEKRLITDIQQYCEKNLAQKYSLNELSTPLRRAIQNNSLSREQNSDGQYEYIAK